MPYNNFTLRSLMQQFPITLHDTTNLYAEVGEVVPDAAFLARLEDEAALALAVSTQKVRSEFIIAPILAELRRMTGRRIGLFSGVDFNIDEGARLNGTCDYIITRSPEQYVLTAPVLMLVEAKNEDMKRGYAQCIAETIAARRFNAQEASTPDDIVDEMIYGAVTIGERWKFLELEGATARIDAADYYIKDIAKIMGILLHLTPSGIVCLQTANHAVTNSLVCRIID